MRFLCFLLAFLWLPVAAMAQGSRLENLLESQLSGEGRIVEIDGFEGALSAQASMEAMRISDNEGLWLELIDVTLDWNRTALLRGRLEVRELSAASLSVLRAPIPVEMVEVPDAEASGFRIPDLPVTIQLDRLAIEEIFLGEPLLGQDVRARAVLGATLADGGLTLLLDATRTDAQPGQARINLVFAPETEELTIDMTVSEPEGGIAATALSLPGAPALSLTVAGGGPLDDFDADFRLATDGEDRLAGNATIAATGTGDRAFAVDLAGDIRPLLDTESRAFFGEDTSLVARGVAGVDGSLTLDDLRLDATELLLEGSAALADGAPTRIALSGQVARTGRTALPGSDVSLAGVDLTVAFDASVSDDWDLSLTAQGVAAPGITIDTLALTGRGQLAPGTAQAFAGDITADVAGLTFEDDPALQSAVGSDVQLRTALSSSDTGTFTFSDLVLQAANVAASGDLRITPGDGRVAVGADLSVSAPDLAPFSQFAGMDLAGIADADISAEADLPGGAISVSLSAQTSALDIGVAELAPLITPETSLDISLTRDADGTRIEALSLVNPELTAEISGSVDAEDGALAIQAALREIGLFTDAVSGAVTLDISLADALGTRGISGSFTTEFGLNAEVSGALAGPDAQVALTGRLSEIERFVSQLNGPADLAADLDLRGDVPLVDARFDVAPGVSAGVSGPLGGPDQALDIVAEIADLAAFAEPLPGPARLEARVSEFDNGPLIAATLTANPGIVARIDGRPTAPDGVVDIRATLEDLGFLVPQLAGPANVDARLSDLTGDLTVAADLSATPGITARITGQPLAEMSRIDLDAALADLGVFAPQLAGPATVSATATDLTGALSITAELTATPGITATVSGQPLAEGGQVDLVARAASLGFLSPQLAGAADITATVTEPTGLQGINARVVSEAGITATLTGRVSSPGDQIALRARVDALSRFVPGLSGGANLTADVTDLQGSPLIDANLTSDTGLRADVDGQLGLPGGAIRVSANGALPLAIAGAFVEDRAIGGNATFDLSLSGQPDPANLTGTIRTTDARVFDPGTGFTLNPIAATIGLSGGRANIDVSAGFEGTPILIAGGAGLSAPFPLELTVRTNQLPLQFQDILTSRVTTDISVSGAAQRQVSIAGDISLAEVEIRIPDTGLGGATAIPDIRHEGADRDTRQTLSRAGLSLSGNSGAGGGGGGPAIPLDLTINAIGPIAVRGRGLDAAFGGGFRVTGTASDPIPVGQFDVERGRLDFLGRRLDVDSGRILIAGSLLPRIEISSTTSVEEVRATIALQGPVDEPELVLSSSPPLPDDEILSRVLFGRGIETLSALQVARLVQSLRKLSGAAGNGFLETARQSLGVDDLDLRTDAETGEASLAIGQTITEEIYSEVEVGSGGNTSITLNFDLTENTTVRGSASSSGETGLGIFWERDY